LLPVNDHETIATELTGACEHKLPLASASFPSASFKFYPRHEERK
jgi:hypothetical protein